MHVNHAASNVVVDVCSRHGTWFDKDELRRVIEFIRGGGLEQSRAREFAEPEEERRTSFAAQSAAAWDAGSSTSKPARDGLDIGIPPAAAALKSLFQ